MREFPQAHSAMVLNGVSLAADYGNGSLEFQALSEAAGLLDMRALTPLLAKGRDVTTFHQGMTSQNIKNLPDGQAADGWILDAGGKVITLVRFCRRSANELFLLAPFAGEDSLAAHLNKYIIMEDVRLERCSDHVLFSLQGPQSHDLVANLNIETLMMFPHDRCGSGGFDLLCHVEVMESLVENLLGQDAQPVGFAALDRARTAAFIPWFSQDIQAQTNPVIYGLAGRVSSNKGCYIGQEVIARIHFRGKPAKQLTGLIFDGDSPEIKPGIELLSADGKNAGTVTSAVFSPKLGKTIALGYVRNAFLEVGTKLAAGENAASVSRLPFFA